MSAANKLLLVGMRYMPQLTSDSNLRLEMKFNAVSNQEDCNNPVLSAQVLPYERMQNELGGERKDQALDIQLESPLVL